MPLTSLETGGSWQKSSWVDNNNPKSHTCSSLSPPKIRTCGNRSVLFPWCRLEHYAVAYDKTEGRCGLQETSWHKPLAYDSLHGDCNTSQGVSEKLMMPPKERPLLMLSQPVPPVILDLVSIGLYSLPPSSEENRMLSMKKQPIQNILSGTLKSLPADGKLFLRPLVKDTGRSFLPLTKRNCLKFSWSIKTTSLLDPPKCLTNGNMFLVYLP